MNSHGVNEWPTEINLNGGREQQMRTSPVTRLGVIQVARGKRDTVVILIGRGPTSHATLFQTPPLSLKVEWKGGSGIHWEAVDHEE